VSLTRVPVRLADRSYEVLIGKGALKEVASLVPRTAGQAVVVTQPAIAVEIATGLPTEVVHIPEGERAKSLATVEELWRRFSRLGLTRSDVVIAVGGGMVTDVAGFAASCWHRGVGVIHVPTTLLGQIDAAIGGKTGVNLAEGKNLVGSIWQPLGVVCDTSTLAALPAAEWRSGRGELAKYAFLGVEDLDELSLDEQVAACVACKARIVEADEREGGTRMTLNYGHTLAHALEAAALAGAPGRSGGSSPPLLRHGEAVAIGLVFAAELALALGRIDAARVARHRELVASYELPGRLPPGADPDELLELMARDKKAQGSLTFVLDGPGGVEPVTGVDPDLVRSVLERLADR
jgi:5-deoxy-5-amino-3-dehydroquinate synthase